MVFSPGGKIYHNLFLSNVPVFYPPKTAENQGLSGFFRRYEITLAGNGLRICQTCERGNFDLNNPLVTLTIL